MTVALIQDGKVSRVWFDAGTERLCVDFGQGFVGSIPFQAIPEDDFESTSPVVAFSVGQEGGVVVCRHEDGVETWLPADMFIPGGFGA